MNRKGEPRRGGMPLGWRKPEGVRDQHQVRAYPDEWLLVKDFVKLMRERGVDKTKNVLELIKNAT